MSHHTSDCAFMRKGEAPSYAVILPKMHLIKGVQLEIRRVKGYGLLDVSGSSGKCVTAGFSEDLNLGCITYPL